LVVQNLTFDGSLLALQEEKELIKLIATYGEVVKESAKDFNPALIAAYLYELSRLFSKYYHDHPILKAPEEALVKARMAMVTMVLQVFRNAYGLLGIPFLESM
ncbi:MAG: DALR anticodon-binding domain-containing protein, partial [Sphaerochaetaceae bacterium]